MAREQKKATRYPYEPDYAVPPGQTLQETIDHLGLDQRELATRAGLGVGRVASTRLLRPALPGFQNISDNRLGNAEAIGAVHLHWT